AVYGKLSGALLVLASLSAWALSRASAEGAGQGAEEVVLRPGVAVRCDNNADGQLRSSPPKDGLLQFYRVERTEGNKRWLADSESGLSGWVEAGEVVRLADAIADLDRK